MTTRSTGNEYLPFYVWGDAAAAGEFFWCGAAFGGIVRDFGRPRVYTWVPVGRALGRTASSKVTCAYITSTQLREDVDLIEVGRELTARAEHTGALDGVHLHVAGIDPATWRSVEVTVSDGDVSGATGGTCYTVLHISEPIGWS